MNTGTDARLQSLEVLVGTWETEMTHPMTPGLVVHGRTTFEWLEGRRFLLQRGTTDDHRFPDSLWVIGACPENADGPTDDHRMRYFDSRGVERTYFGSLRDGQWRWHRDHDGFDQRFVGSFTTPDEIVGQSQLRRTDTWDDDLAITYRRATATG